MENIKAFDWNVIVVGRWNPSILTPKGIASFLFQKPEDFPFEILVPLNAVGPFKVRIDGMTVSADYERLIVECEKTDWETLAKAKASCCAAIDALPRTPLEAAGFNIRYHIEEPSEALTEILSGPLDNLLADHNFTIRNREVRRTVEWMNGTINLHISKLQAGKYSLLMNFDKTSSSTDELRKWLECSTDSVREITEKILNMLFVGTEV